MLFFGDTRFFGKHIIVLFYKPSFKYITLEFDLSLSLSLSQQTLSNPYNLIPPFLPHGWLHIMAP